MNQLSGKFKNPTTLMVQGCTSDAGKSVMVAGIARLLARQGIKVAPFKPQNMALNSAVTKEGGEIGRAQALQAKACYLEPCTDFNPILLKPSSDTGAQVIVHGKAIDQMQAKQFHDYKKVAMNAVLESHQRLHQTYDCIIVEGAGSPAEINLREGDIANMGFAETVDCPVILIADIDRGGVFAHLVGTLELLSSSEQARVVGFIINRFRGDKALLDPGLQWLEEKTGKPVLGVVPFLDNLYLDAEDAIAIAQTQSLKQQPLKVVVPVFPRISNHTDFDALRLHPNVDLTYVSLEQPCPAADLIILPGSKNVINDCQKLMDNGWQTHLQKHLRYGGKILGICGGYQVLGRAIDDPDGIENNGKANSQQGLGLLNIETTLHPNKQLATVSGNFTEAFIKSLSNTTAAENESNHTKAETNQVSGYEIHCGVTESLEQPLLSLNNGNHDGAISDDQQIIGTYLHGIFDQADAADLLLQWAGFQANEQAPDLDQIRETQLNRLADTIEKHVDMSQIAQWSQIISPTNNRLSSAKSYSE